MILVTGGLGFIGSHTTRALLDLGEDCVATAHRNLEPPEFLVGTPIEPLDCADLTAFIALGEKYPITAIVHLASAPATGDPVDHLRESAAGVLNALTAAHRWGARIVVASTIGVYGGVPGDVYREDAPLPPIAPHAIPAAKKAAELYAAVAGQAGGFDATIARIGAIWGPLGRTDSPFIALPRLVHAAARGVAAARPGYADDGTDLCYVADCARGLALLATAARLRHRTYNVAAGRVTTDAEVAAAIRAVRPDAPVGLLPGATHEAARMDVSRLTADTGYRPEYDVRRGVAEYLRWLETHPR